MTISNALIFKNTLTNYLVLASRLIEGILLTRILYNGLGQSLYGFWGLLWSFFTYVILLDFGLSKAAQKYTSQRLYEQDSTEYNKIVSTVFGMQFAMSGVILVMTFFAMLFLEELTNIHDADMLQYCRISLGVLGAGVAITFPTGIFPALLVALHKIYLRNYVIIGVRILELAGIYLILKLGGSILAMAIYCVILNISANMIMLVMVYLNVPRFRIGLCFSWQTMKKLSQFSGYVYLTALANLVSAKLDRMVLSAFSGLEAAGLYQLSTRLSEMVENSGIQFHENLTPIAASLHKKDDQKQLRKIIALSTRVSAILATCVTALAFLLAPEAINVLF